MEKRQVLAVAVASPQPESQRAVPPSAGVILSPLSERETNRRDAETVAGVDNIPLDPSRKGYIQIPGTESSW
jgi:hypothetical protein